MNDHLVPPALVRHFLVVDPPGLILSAMAFQFINCGLVMMGIIR